NPQTGTSLAGVSAASSSGLYGVREGAILGIDHGALGKAWAYDIAAQQVLWTSRSLPWPHYFVDLSGIGGSAPPGQDAVLLAVCGRVATQPAGIATPRCARPELAVLNRSPGPTRSGRPPPIHARRRSRRASAVRISAESGKEGTEKRPGHVCRPGPVDLGGGSYLRRLAMSARRRRRPDDGAPRVIVVGGGFAGLAAVKELNRAGAQVMLVDRNIYSTFQPLLYQVATGGLNPGDVAFPLRVFATRHGTMFRHGELQSIDAAGRRITLTDGTELDYDYLVLGTGVSAAYYGVTGAAGHTVGLYTRHDAVTLRDHVMARLDRLGIQGPGKAVNFTVVGGGATGVELAGALAELRALHDAFPEVSPEDEKITLVEMAPALLAPFQPKLQAYALAELRRRGVDVRLNTK